MNLYRNIFSNTSGSFLLVTLAALSLLSPRLWAQQKSDAKSDKSNKLYGEAAIVTNYVDKGVTQSDKAPALQAGFGYQMGPQARLGLWGSSVKFPSATENLNLRMYADIKMEFTSNTNMVMRYDFNRYFQSDQHNGSLLGLDLSTFGYHVLFEMNDNWEGLRSGGATWFAFKKEFQLPRGFVFTPQLGYTQTSAAGYASYFDTRTSIGYKFADVMYELVHTFNSNGSQFAGRGNMTVLFGLNVRF